MFLEHHNIWHDRLARDYLGPMPKRPFRPFRTTGRRVGGRYVRKRMGGYAGRAYVASRAAAIRSRAIARFIPYGRAALGAYTGYSLLRGMMARKRLFGTPKRAIAYRDYSQGTEGAFAPIIRKNLRVSVINHNLGILAENQRGIVMKKFYVSGMKMCMKYKSNSNFATRVHYAILQSKCDRDDLSVGGVSTDFFISKRDGTDRTVDFINDGSWSNEQDCNPINNRKWNILFHKRFTLGPRNNESQDNTNLNNWKIVDKWIPIKKTFELDDPDAVGPSSGLQRKPLIFVTWYDFAEPNGAGPVSPIEANVSFTSYNKNVG